MRPTAAFRSLRTRNYRLYFLGQLVSLAGTWMQEVAQAWLVLRLTDSPLALGLTVTIRFAPTLFLALLGGLLADRVPKRRVLMLTQTVMLAQAVVMTILTAAGLITFLHICLLSAVRGVADALDVPARQSMVVELVGPADVGNAVGLNSSLFNLARIVGPALGGIVVASLGVAVCFFINSVSFLAVLVALALMRTNELHAVARPAAGRVRTQLAEGIRFAVGTPQVVTILVLVAAIGTFGYNFQVILPLMAKYALGTGPAGLGALTSALGAGSLLAGLTAAHRTSVSQRVFLGGAAGFSLMLLLVGLSSSMPVTLGLLAGAGFCGILFHTAANTRLQLIVPDQLRGRVLSIYFLLFLGTTPLGSLLAGTLAEQRGVQETVVVLALLCAIGVGVGLLLALRTRRERLRPALQSAVR